MFCVQYMIVLWGFPLLLPIRVLIVVRAHPQEHTDTHNLFEGCTYHEFYRSSLARDITPQARERYEIQRPHTEVG